MAGIGNTPPSGPKGPSGPGPIRPTGPGQPADKAGDVQKSSFSVPPSGSESTPASQSAVQPNLDRLRGRIADGMKRSLSKDEILQEVIDGEVKDQFGDDASKEMAQTITEAFRNDPQLQALFNRLYALAGGA